MSKNIQRNIENLARQHTDKVLHFIAGYLLFVFGFAFVGCWLALGLVIVIAIAKELYDTLKKEPTGYGWLDFAFTVSGALPAFLITL